MRWIKFSIGLSVFFVIFVVLWPLPKGVNEGNMSAIKVGMTEAEVESLLQTPAGDFSGDFGVLIIPNDIEPPQGPSKTWLGRKFGVRIWFDSLGNVAAYAHGNVLHVQLNGLNEENAHAPFWFRWWKHAKGHFD